MDKVDKKTRTHIMSSIKSSDSKIEVYVRKILKENKIRFRTNVSTLYGKPDISIKKYKIVLFVDSCFWHGCSVHSRMPKNNLEYWQQKIQRNKNRDYQVNEYYKNSGWHVIRLWEHDVRTQMKSVVSLFKEIVNKHQS